MGRVIMTLIAASALLLATGLWIPAKAWLAQQLLTQAWLETETGGRHKPWPWADTWPVARLHFTSLDQQLIVLNGTSGASLPFGPGHLSASAEPGMGGTVVIAGHRDTHFRLLEQVNIGDDLILEPPGGQRRLYRVSEIDVVNSEDRALALDPHQDRLVLVTCFPFNSVDPGGPLRYVVTARPVTAA